MPILAQAQKLIVVLVLIVAVFALVLGVFIGNSFSVVPLDTTTHAYQYYGWSGIGQNPNGQFLDATQYVTSWSPALQSEKIVPKAAEAFAWPGTACVKEYRTRAFLSTDGVAWNEMTGSPWTYPAPSATGPGPFPLTTPAIQITGSYVGGIKVDEELHIADGYCLLDKGWLTVLTDQAYLVSGIGKITADAQGQVGSVVKATVTVGYLSSQLNSAAGWSFFAFSSAQNKVVLGPVDVTQLQQTFSYTLTAADFSTASGCGGGNRIEWHLFNELWQKDFAYTTVIDVSQLAPSFKFMGFAGDPVANGTITVSWTAAPNAVSQLPLQQIVIAYGYGGVSNVVNLTGNATSLSIPLGSNGNLHVEGYALDTGCRPSPADRMDVFVRTPGAGNTTRPNWLIFFLVFLGMGGLGGVIAYLAKGPLWSRALIAGFFLIFGLVIAFLVQPGVLNPATYLVGAGGGPWL